MGVNVEELPDSCFVRAELIIGTVTFVVDSYKQKMNNPDENDCIITNIYGESLRVTKKTLINTVVRLSQKPIKMSSIVGGKEYKGIFSVSNRMGKKKPSDEEAEKFKEETGQVRDFMTQSEPNKFMAVYIPDNCKAFVDGSWNPGGCYYVTHSKLEGGTKYIRFSKEEFKRLFRVPQQEGLEILSECEVGSQFSMDNINEFVNEGKKAKDHEQRKIKRSRSADSAQQMAAKQVASKVINQRKNNAGNKATDEEDFSDLNW